MRILQIVGDSKFGGGSVVVLRLAEHLCSQGWKVDVLTTDPKTQTHARKAGLGVVELDCIWRDIRPVKDAVGARRLRRFLSCQEYDVIHTHTSKAGFVGRWAAKNSGATAIFHTVHGFAFHEHSSKLSISLFSKLEQIAARWCDKIITVSEFHRDWAMRLGIADADKLVAIPNGLAQSRIQPTDPFVVRRELEFGEDDFVVLSAGRLAAQKGLEDLIAAVPRLASLRTRTIRVVIAGDGPLRTSLQALVDRLGVNNQVKFTGFRTDIGNLLAACDVVALPSLREGLSIALLEAMASKRPIIATRIGSNLEACEETGSALFVPTNDPDAIASALARLAQDWALGQELASNAKATFDQRYTEARMLSQYTDLYRAHAPAGSKARLNNRTAA